MGGWLQPCMQYVENVPQHCKQVAGVFDVAGERARRVNAGPQPATVYASERGHQSRGPARDCTVPHAESCEAICWLVRSRPGGRQAGSACRCDGRNDQRLHAARSRRGSVGFDEPGTEQCGPADSLILAQLCSSARSGRVMMTWCASFRMSKGVARSFSRLVRTSSTPYSSTSRRNPMDLLLGDPRIGGQERAYRVYHDCACRRMIAQPGADGILASPGKRRPGVGDGHGKRNAGSRVSANHVDNRLPVDFEGDVKDIDPVGTPLKAVHSASPFRCAGQPVPGSYETPGNTLPDLSSTSRPIVSSLPFRRRPDADFHPRPSRR